MNYQPTEPEVFEEPPEGWCNALFKATGSPDPDSIARVTPIVRWYNCRLPKGHPETQDHTCFAFRLGK